MKLFNSTNKWANWWKNRKIDWNQHYMNPDHPHRLLIAQTLRSMGWLSLIEVGCGAGANLVQILKACPGRQVGGVDINPEAIECAKKYFQNAIFKVGPADNMIISDQATDVILTDMCMIYISPWKMKKHLTEFKRVARSYVVLCEFHSPNFWQRLWVKWTSGYNMYNWPKLLEKNGFDDVRKYKIPKDFWPGGLQEKFGYIIVAKVPKYY